jgi:predicted RNase H-like nuclease (RuvC/YqgF family)
VRRPVAILLVLIGVGLLASTALFYSKYQKSEANVAQMTAENQDTQLRYGQAINEIAAIQDSLNAIVLGDDEARMISGSSQSEVPLPATSREQAFARIEELKAGIERTKERITELDSRLKRSNIRVAGLQKMITNLRKNVGEKETMIVALSTQVDSLETRVAGLTTEVEDKSQQIVVKEQELTEKQRELATVYYTMGTKKDLIQSNVVVAKGGVFGIGKTLEPSGHVNETAFIPLNTDQENVIRIPSKDAQILSAQPQTSYNLVKVGEDQLELRILDPREFRKVKHLVILTS